MEIVVHRIHNDALCVGVALLLGQSTSRPPQTHVLDFISNRPSAEALAEADKAGRYARPLVVQFQAGDGPVPFDVTLESVDRGGYTMGDDIEYDVIVKHNGTKPFPFPLSQDRLLLNQELAGPVKATILLSIKDDTFGAQLIGFENIALGAVSVPESVAMLQPGDVIKIRAHGRWLFMKSYAKNVPNGVFKNVKIKAHIQIEGVVGYSPIVESRNAIEIQLRLPG